MSRLLVRRTTKVVRAAISSIAAPHVKPVIASPGVLVSLSQAVCPVNPHLDTVQPAGPAIVLVGIPVWKSQAALVRTRVADGIFVDGVG